MTNYKLYLGENLLCPPCEPESDSDLGCQYIECGGTLAYADCGLIKDPGFYYYMDCCRCECIKMPLFNIWEAIEWQANKFCNSGYKIDPNPVVSINRKSLVYNQYLIY